jgi:exo-1,4-beta-D-glucosaminidase
MMSVTSVTATGGAGSWTPLRTWHLASTSDVGDAGATVSLPGFDASSWTAAPARSTVMGALVRSGEVDDVFYSSTMRDRVDRTRFCVPWWFRSLFTVSGAGRTHVRVCGVIPRAELWVNGQLVLDARTLAGAYDVETVDVTDVVSPGLNALALLVHPGDPMQDLSIGWVDWSQAPPDHNMGPWRDVVIGRTGPVQIGAPHVVTAFDPEVGALRAHLTVSVDVYNRTSERLAVLLAGVVTGDNADLAFSREVVLRAGEYALVSFGGTPADEPGDAEPLGADDGGAGEAAGRAGDVAGGGADAVRLVVEDPELWWPAGDGRQPLYDASVTAHVRGLLSDHAETTFGIRTVTSEIRPGGGRQFAVNGRPVQVLGAGWSPDLFLRHDHRRLAAQLALAAHLGLNAIRPEGKLENPEFYDLCDALGLMVLPGWECCNKWEAAAGTGGTPWDVHDAVVAERSMASEAELLRSHPSVVAFLIGSDFAPPEDVAARYVRALEAKGWDLPVVASATAQGTAVTGASGMKMTGPYDWVPPVYWYGRDPELGGAVGFNSETSAGHTVPRMASLRRMLSDEELDRLWQHPSLPQYHSGPESVFDNLGLFATALTERYGAPTGAEDFVEKAQLAAYEAVRAQFEAFTSRACDDQPATGVVYWMLTPPWPSLNWQLFDYELDTPGSYWGARKALERLHVLYAYDAGTVQVLNRTGAKTGPHTVVVRRWRVDGALAGDDRHELASVAPGVPVDVTGAESPQGVTGAWFLELELYGPAGRQSRNVYWLSGTADVLDHSARDWFTTGVSQYADLRAVGGLRVREARRPRVRARATAEVSGADVAVAVHLHHDDPTGPPAVQLHASVHRAGAPVAPVLWDDNDVTLFRGQSVVLTGRLRAAAAGHHERLRVEVGGFNLHRPLVLPLDVPPPGPGPAV